MFGYIYYTEIPIKIASAASVTDEGRDAGQQYEAGDRPDMHEDCSL